MIGFLNINKPVGLSSRDVVEKIQGRLNQQVPGLKVGHCGTLDPLADGVLVLAIGRATVLTRLLQHGDKRYLGRFRLGLTSESNDTESSTQEVPVPVVPTQEMVQSVLQNYVGILKQVPPKFSAVRIGGKRAYELARKGKVFEVPEREVEVYNLTLTYYQFPDFELDIHCSGGTYVRSLGRDIAVDLGTAAVMTALTRTQSCNFLLQQAGALDSLIETNIDPRLLTKPVDALDRFPTVVADQESIDRFRNGLVGFNLMHQLNDRRIAYYREERSQAERKSALQQINLQAARDNNGTSSKKDWSEEYRVVTEDGLLVGMAVYCGDKPFEKQWAVSVNFAHSLLQQKISAANPS